jgi:hypothetical protein
MSLVSIVFGRVHWTIQKKQKKQKNKKNKKQKQKQKQKLNRYHL